MKNYTKEEAIKIVVSCAQNYHNELENKSLLFVCIDKHYKVSVYEFFFNGWNYLHLTGLKAKQSKAMVQASSDEVEKMSASDFYNRCLNHKLSSQDFEFSKDGTTQMKLDVLPSLINKNLSAKMIGNCCTSRPQLYSEKLAGGQNACMGFIVDSITRLYVPNTVLKVDIRNNVTDYEQIVLTYRKNNTDDKYEEITYKAKKVDWSRIELPPELKHLPLE